jgi:alkylation response protein AidB-like acyl-CoA dehydrogenase
MDLTLTDEQVLLREQVLRFARREIVPRVREHDLSATFDRQSWLALGRQGILGLHLPEEYGGGGADVVTCLVVGEALGRAGVDGGLTLSFGAHSFLCADTIATFGTDEQKARWLPGLATGERIGCLGLTEPDAGSDAAALRTRAERVDGGWKLNGSKTFITNGSIADVAIVIAKSDPAAGHAGMSAFVVERGTPGFEATRDLHKMGVRASPTSELVLTDCVVPDGNLIGGEGAGFLIAMHAVEWDRCTLIAPFLGGMEFVLDRCCRYAAERRQFGRPIASFQAVRHRIADIKIFVEAARGLIFRVGRCKDEGRPMAPLEASVAKLFIGDWSLAPANDAVVLHGGYGYCHEYDVERVFRDGRLAPIGGGTSDIQRVVISRLMLEEGEGAGSGSGSGSGTGETLALAATRACAALLGGEDGGIGAVAMTGPDGGEPRVSGPPWRLSGRASMVTNGPVAGRVAVIAAGPDGDVICAVDPGAPGVTKGPRVATPGLKDVQLCDFAFDGVEVAPVAAPDARVRYGLMADLAIAEAATGLVDRVLDAAKRHATSHRRGGKPIAAHQEVRFKLAEILTLRDACDLLVGRAAGMVARGDPEAPTLVRCARVFCAESAERAASAAAQVAAGAGYVEGSEFERAWNDTRGLAVAGTPIEVSRMAIADDLLARY